MKNFYFPQMKKLCLNLFLPAFLLCMFYAGAKIHAQSFPDGFSRVQVTNGISKPTVMAFAPDGRIFVAEQGGNLRVIKNGSLLSTPFISLSVNSAGERGLIGITLDPNFSANQYIYLYYTLPDASRNRVSRFTANGDVVVPGSEVVVLDLDPLSSATNHNGGAMHFGPDGKLYIAVGENASPSKAQDLNTYHGKILRINPDGSVPSGNPFTTGSAQQRRVWSYGLRNPYTFDIQPGTERIFVNDVGQNTWEEINDASTGGLNFGWPTAEGNSSNSSFVNPVFAYQHGSGDGKGCAITGGVFFNSSATNYPAEYQGRYFYLDYCNSWINMLNLSGGVTRLPFATSVGGSIVSLEVGNDGNLYYLSRSANALYKIIYTNADAPAITNQPASLTVPEGQSASFTVSASGTAPLSYQWQKNGTNISGATAATYTISNARLSDAGNYRVVVSNSAGSATSNAATLTVTEFNAEPVPQIITPVAGTLYQGGQTISFSGNATDEEDGTLPASAFTWEVVFYHDTHNHDGPPVASGTKSGSFVIPTTGETSDNVWYRLFLTVEDSEGLSATVYRDIYPKKSTLSFATVPAGLTVTLDGQPLSTPAAVVSVEGIERTIGVVSPQTANGKTYEFASWQHGGSATQTIITPEEDVTYTAVFNEVSSDLPAPWNHTDIGSVAAAGNASFSSGTFSVTGSGDDIWNTADEFQYVYQTLEGDGEISGRITSITNTNQWAKAGFMMRETLGNNVRHAAIFVTPSQGVAFQRRTSAGSSSTHTGTSGTAPVWLKLTRAGNTFTGYKSTDGSNWQQVGSENIPLGSQVYVGMAVTAHNDGALNTAAFTQVNVEAVPPPFDPVTLEAEEAQFSGPQIASNHAGYTGAGFLDYINPSSDYIRWTVEVPATGEYMLTFRYALGGGNRPLQIKVNDVTVVSSLSFTATGSWATWGTVGTTVTLQAGTNTIQATAIGSSGANIDHLVVSEESQNLMLANAPANARFGPEVIVYPNPAEDFITIANGMATEATEYQIIDLSGRQMAPIRLENNGGSSQLDVSQLKNGWYILMIRNEQQVVYKKFIIQHK